MSTQILLEVVSVAVIGVTLLASLVISTKDDLHNTHYYKCDNCQNTLVGMKAKDYPTCNKCNTPMRELKNW